MSYHNNNSSNESDTDVHSDGEDGVARLIRQFEPTKIETHRSIDSLSKATCNLIVHDGIMSAPPDIKSPGVQNIPIVSNQFGEKIGEGKIQSECKTASEGQINRRALLKCSSTYELEKFNKNAMIIFNQKTIPGYEERLGTEEDVAALEYTFKRFGFEVKEEKDLTKAEVLSTLDRFSNTDFTDYGCVAVVVLTHGSRQGQLRASDMPYDETELINRFMKKPFLVSKPILFVIQACRGTKDMDGILVHPGSQVQKDHNEYTLPVAADMLVVHSSYIGNPSHRNVLYGSWFIQSLCRKINELADSQDLLSILTEILREVAIDYEEATHKQMPTLSSTLIRKLYLRTIREDEVCRKRPDTLFRNKVWNSATPHSSRLHYGQGQCSYSCFLRYFNYIKKCLSYFVEENPTDIMGSRLLNVANTFKCERELNNTKEELLRTMCDYLELKAEDCTFYKYVYMYENGISRQ